jgi:hemolysin D
MNSLSGRIINAVNGFGDAWQAQNAASSSVAARQLSEFLPAALEIQATPPNPLAKWCSRSLMLLFAVLVLWACVGKVNIVAIAEGKIIPGSRVKQIQPLDKGIVKIIHVQDGQFVQQGEPLIEFDQTITAADQQRVRNEYYIVQTQLARMKALKAALDLDKEVFNAEQAALYYQAPAGTALHDSSLQQQLLQQEWDEYLANKSVLISALNTRQAELQAGVAIIKKLESTLPIITRRVSSFKQLLDRQMLSETQYLELEQQRIEQYQDLAAQRSRQEQIAASIREIKGQLHAQYAQVRASNLIQIAEKQRELSVLREELAKVEGLHARQVLYAPVDGVIQELAVSTVGGVVQEAQKLMLIVPGDEQLEVQAMLPNKDIGFVKEGMTGEIKIHTFPFTRYGVVDAEVVTISDDAVADEKLGLVYALNLKLKNNTIKVDGKAIKLMPGMSLTVEMKTGKRRLIEFFLAPLLRYQRESVRER